VPDAHRHSSHREFRVRVDPGDRGYIDDPLDLDGDYYDVSLAGTSAPERRTVRAELVGIAALAALAGFDSLWFAALGENYFRWYIDNGAVIALLFGVVAASVDLDTHPALIAASPRGFIRGVVGVILELTLSLRILFGGAWRAESARPWPDRALARMFRAIFTAAMCAWALVVAPLQYVVNLVCGAPGRMALAAERTVWRVKVGTGATEYVEGARDLSEDGRRSLAGARQEGRAREITFATRPVTFAAAIAAALLFGASQLV
jgi:hypothetical protein